MIPAPTLRLVSANLRNGTADPAAFAALVAALDPDVVAVQELAPEQADRLAAVLPHGKLEPGRDYKGMGIALRQPAPVWRLALPYRGAWVAELGPLEVVNVHVLAPHVPPFWPALGIRRRQLRGLLEYFDGDPARRRVLLGDLNATPLWPLYRRLAARLADAAVEAARGNGARPRRTWAPWPWVPRLLRIDHALVSGLGVEAVRTVRVRGSDHDALVLDLRRPGAGARPGA